MSLTVESSLPEGFSLIPDSNNWRVVHKDSRVIIGGSYRHLRAHELAALLHSVGDMRNERNHRIAVQELHSAMAAGEPGVLHQRSAHEVRPGLWSLRCCTVACGDSPRWLTTDGGNIYQSTDLHELIYAAPTSSWVRVNDQQHWMCPDCADSYSKDSPRTPKHRRNAPFRVHMKASFDAPPENLGRVRRFMVDHGMDPRTIPMRNSVEIHDDGTVVFDRLMSDPVIIACHPNGDPILTQVTVPQVSDFPSGVIDREGMVYLRPSS